MSSKNISSEIVCKYKNECSSYSIWVGDGKNSKCKNCKNNEYQELKKEDYYKANTPTKIANAVTIVLVLGGLTWFGYWFLLNVV